jgi:hypothetical protein
MRSAGPHQVAGGGSKKPFVEQAGRSRPHELTLVGEPELAATVPRLETLVAIVGARLPHRVAEAFERWCPEIAPADRALPARAFTAPTLGASSAAIWWVAVAQHAPWIPDASSARQVT